MAIPARFKGIDHVVLRSTDIPRTLAFYTEVLGLHVERIFDRIGLHQLRCGQNLIDIVPLDEGAVLAAPADRGIEHLCLAIEGDFDAVCAGLAAQNVPIVLGPMEVYGASGFGTSIYIADPDGYQIELKFPFARKPVKFP